MKITRQTRSSGWRLLFILACLLPVLWLLAGNAAAEQATGGKDDGTCRNDYSQCFKERLPIQEMRAVAYTAAFAKRFGLPPPPPGTEPNNGLEALEVKVQRRGERADDAYCMKLSLYLDSHLAIKLPKGEPSGNERMVCNPSHFFGNSFKERHFEKWSEEDKRHLVALDSNYRMKAFLGSMDYGDGKMANKGYPPGDSIVYDEYHTELLPGLTYIRLFFFEPLILDDTLKHKKYTDVGVFLLRATDRDYRHTLSYTPDNFYKFRLPNHILAKMKEWVEMMKPVNATIMKEKELREQQE